MDVQSPPAAPAHRRRRLALWVLASLAVMALLAAFVIRMGQPRQSAVRAFAHATLHSVAQAAAEYQRQLGTPPTLDAVLAFGMFDVERLKAFSRGEPVAEQGPAGRKAWLVQTEPCRAVRKGEAWGGPGDTIDHDLPPCRFVLTQDWTVVQLDEPVYQRELALHLRLTPLR